MLKKPLSIVLILISGVASWLVAMVNVPIDKMEMGALFNLFGPPIILTGSIIFFLLIDWQFPSVRLYNVFTFCLINIVFGIYIRNWSISQIG
jgi:hypothetical protein